MTDLDPVELEILRNQLESVAEEMGQVLIRGAYSPNIKERQDCSTALFDAEGRMVAQAEHIPVHLGAMPEAVEAVLALDPEPGDTFVVNDPFAGGTHLPDVTLVSPLAPESAAADSGASDSAGTDDDASDSADGDDGVSDAEGEREIVGYAVSRAHHADVGGASPGSMPADSREVYQEGLRIPPVRLVSGGEVNEDVRDLLLANVRTPDERRADLRAQMAANDRAEERVGELLADHGDRLLRAFDAVIEYSRERVESELRELPDGEYRARDFLEGDGVSESDANGGSSDRRSDGVNDDDVPVEATVTVDGSSLSVDFSGTADQVPGNLNAPLAVAKSAVYFVARCVTDPEIPPNHGCYAPVSVNAPEGCLLNPDPPAAVVGGNVETSQRVTDVVLRALADAVPDKVPAAGQGTMNNLIIGSREGEFTYYETIGGGFGARPAADGMDGVQVGMTNTLNTPVEALEAEYPLRVDRYALRPDSGGDGEFRGGLGLERSVTVLTDATVSLLTERRRHAPQGLEGGEAGEVGENRVDGERVGAKTTAEVPAGTTVTVLTPGGGGYGDPDERDSEARERDRTDGKVTDGE